MASRIEWTGHTWNPIVGCSVVSPGCKRCYAMRLAARLERMGQARYARLTVPTPAGSVWTGEVRFVESALTLPLRRRVPTTYFVNSMSDLFHKDVPDALIDRVFAVMALCPQHTFQVLTKRSGRMRAYCLDSETRRRILAAALDLCRTNDQQRQFAARFRWPLPSVWLGVSAEDQTRADERVPDLLATPAAVRFVSAEPMLGPIDFRDMPYPSPPEDEGRRGSALDGHEVAGMVGNCIAWLQPLDWIIVGGESGHGARPMHPDWARSIRDQCAAAEVAFFFKQWGEWLPGTQYQDLHRQLDPSETDSRFACMDWDGERYDRASSFWADEPSAHAVFRVGKRAAGRLLDGIAHNAMPEVRA